VGRAAPTRRRHDRALFAAPDRIGQRRRHARRRGSAARRGAAADIEALAAWVRRGGRLVYLGRDPARIGIETRALQLPFFVPDVGARGALRGPDAAVVRALDDLGTNRMLLVEHPGRVELADGNGDIVVRYALGRGEVTAVSDALPFTNANIARADDARLAYLVALPGRRGGVVAFDDGLQGALIDRPWYRALPIPVRVTLTIAAIALLLGLIGSALRGASPVRLEGPREPTSQEFVDALAALHARIGARAAARDVLRRAALAAVARGVGLAADAPPAELGARLRERPGAAAVRRLIAASNAPPANDAELVASAQLAHTVWKDWMHAGSGDHGRAAFAGRARSGRRR
jgi:hypothetical protein